jgi:hypothetical protein
MVLSPLDRPEDGAEALSDLERGRMLTSASVAAKSPQQHANSSKRRPTSDRNLMPGAGWIAAGAGRAAP